MRLRKGEDRILTVRFACAWEDGERCFWVRFFCFSLLLWYGGFISEDSRWCERMGDGIRQENGDLSLCRGMTLSRDGFVTEKGDRFCCRGSLHGDVLQRMAVACRGERRERASLFSCCRCCCCFVFTSKNK